jgi:hypothetical protein
MVNTVPRAGHRNYPKRLLKQTDMTIQWKALDGIISSTIYLGKMHSMIFFSQKTSVLKEITAKTEFEQQICRGTSDARLHAL